MDIQVRVHEDFDLGGGYALTQGVHSIPLDELANYEQAILDGILFFPLQIKDLDNLNQQLNEQIFNLYQSDVEILGTDLNDFGGILGIDKGGTGEITANDALNAFLPPQSGKPDFFLKTDGLNAGWASVPTGITIGSTSITSGTNDRILYQSGGVVSQSANFTYDGATLKVKAANSSQTANIFEAIRYDGEIALQVDDDSSVTLGANYDYANGKHAAQHIVKYAAGGSYNGKALLLWDLSTGYKSRIHTSLGNGLLYVTQDDGTAGGFAFGTWTNPADASTLIASSGRWIINLGAFVVNNSTWSGNNQLESYSTSLPQFASIYDSSNYSTWKTLSNGAVEFDAVGTGAKFTFKDDVELADAKNIIIGTTTGTKIGTGSTEKIGFFGVTPVTQRSITGSTEQDQIDSIVAALNSLGLATDDR